MKLRLRIGRQQTRTVETAEVRTVDGPAERAPEPPTGRTAVPTSQVPLPRTPDRPVVRVGSFCRVGDIGRTAVTETGRAVLAVHAGRCGRWVYDERA